MKLTREDSVIVIGLHRMVNDMDRRTKQICKKYDLTLGQFGVLEALNSKGDLTVGQVKDMVLSTDGTITVITGNLEKLGYITRTQDAKDKRKFILSLTEQGREIIGQVYPENNKMLTELLSVLDKEEKKQISNMIAKYRKHKKRSWYSAKKLGKADYMAIIATVIFCVAALAFTFYDGSRFYNPFV